MQNNTQALIEKIGIKKLFEIPYGKVQSSTVLVANGKEYLMVSQMLNIIADLINLIKDKLGIDEQKYSITISFLRSVQLVLTNGESVNLSVLERICAKLDCDF